MKFDLIIITAANAAQARGYRAQIAWRRKCGMLPAGSEVKVVADPGGKRVGSLGATVNALKKLGFADAKALKGKRIFICHSGGDARRTPGYAAMGKAFTPLPVKGRMLAMFDLILANMMKLKLPSGGGVLVACGDVLITFDFAAADFTGSGVTGVAYADTPERGSRHGVYVPGKGGCVKAFLQKPDLATMKATGALKRNKVAVDTGIMWIDGATAAKMIARGWETGDLYQEFTGELLNGFAPFSVHVAPKCDFFHIGSSRELLACMTAPSPTAKLHGFEVRDTNFVGQDIFVAENGNIVTNMPPDCPFDIALRENECVTFLPIGAKEWVRVDYMLDDNFKSDGKWDRKIYRLGGRKVCLGELMPQVNHARLLKARG